MKHRVLFKRALAVTISVSMIMSMCTTGFASVDGTAESQETTVSPLSVDLDESVSGDTGASEDRSGEQSGSSGGTDSSTTVEGTDNGQDNVGGDDGKSDAGTENTGNADGSGTTEGDTQDQGTDNKDEETSENTGSGDSAGNEGNTGSGDNTGDEGNTGSGDNTGDDTSTNGGDNTGDSNSNTGDHADEEQKDPVEGTDESQGSSENGNENNQENIDKPTEGAGENTGDVTDGSGSNGGTGGSGGSGGAGTGNPAGTVTVPDQVIPPVVSTDNSALDRYMARYEKFMEKYQEDQDAELEGKERVNFKTWKSIKSAIVDLLDGAKELEDQGEAQSYVIELKEIFISEAADEFVRLAVKLIEDIKKEQEHIDEEAMPSQEELEEILTQGPASDFVQMVDGLVQELESDQDSVYETGIEHEEEIEETSAEKTEADSVENTDETGSVSGESLETETVETDQVSQDTSEAEEEPAVSPEETEGNQETSPQEETEGSQNETSPIQEEDSQTVAKGPAEEFIRDVNSLIYDMVTVLADSKGVVTGEKLKDLLSGKEEVSSFLFEITGWIQMLLDSLTDNGLMLTIELSEEEIWSEYIEAMCGITEALFAGSYVSDESGLLDDIEKVHETLTNAMVGLLTSGNDAIASKLARLDNLQMHYEEYSVAYNCFKQDIEVDLGAMTDSIDYYEYELMDLCADTGAISSLLTQYKSEMFDYSVSVFVKEMENLSATWKDSYSDKELVGNTLLKINEDLQNNLYYIRLFEGNEYTEFTNILSDISTSFVQFNNCYCDFKDMGNVWYILQADENFKELKERLVTLETALNGYKEKVGSEGEIPNISGENSSIISIIEETYKPDYFAASVDDFCERVKNKQYFYVGLESYVEELNTLKELAGSVDGEDETVKAASEKLAAVEVEIEKLVQEKNTYLKDHDSLLAACKEFIEDTAAEKINGSELLAKIDESLLKLTDFRNNKTILTEKEIDQYRIQLEEQILPVALKEYGVEIRHISDTYPNCEQKEIIELSRKIKKTEDLRLQYLSAVEGDNAVVLEELEKEFSDTRVKAFLAMVEKLGVAVEKEVYKDYNGYYEFSTDMKTVEGFLENVMPDVLEENKQAIEEGKAKLKELRSHLATHITPEILAMFTDFKDQYDKLKAEYKTLEWEAVLERVTDLEKLAENFPKELYEELQEQRSGLNDILAQAAVKEFDRIYGELEAWFQNPDVDSPEAISEKLDRAEKLIDYMYANDEEGNPLSPYEYAQKLEPIRQKLELVKNHNTSEGIDAFLKAVDHFLKEVENGTFFKNGDSEQGLLVFKLLSANDGLENLYDSLNDIEKDQEKVKEAYNQWKEVWSKLSKEDPDTLKEENRNLYEFYEGLIQSLRDFVESVNSLKEYYDRCVGVEQEDDGWKLNLKLAYEQCKSKMEELLSKQDALEFEQISDNFGFARLENHEEFIKAKEELEALKAIIDNFHLEDGGKIPTAGTYVVGQALAVGDKVSVPAVTGKNATEFVNLARTMYGRLNDVGSMVGRIKELADTLCYGDLTEMGKETTRFEIEMLYSEISRIIIETHYDNWHGLAGGTAYAHTAWGDDIENPMIITIEPVAASILDIPIDEYEKEETIKKVEEIFNRIDDNLIDLEVRINIAEVIVDAMDAWSWNNSLIGVEELDFAAERYSLDEIDKLNVISSSRANSEEAIAICQTFEAAMSAEHAILQRMSEVAVSWGAGWYHGKPYEDTEKLRECAMNEINLYSKGLTFLAQYVNYDNWHGMGGYSESGKAIIPTGYFECHKGEIEITNLTAQGLELEFDGTEDAESILSSIEKAIKKASYARSILGAWQNTYEHIVNLCEITEKTGPLIGNKFDKSDDGHHIPLYLTGWFERTYYAMCNRVDDLKEQQNSTEDNFSWDHIQREIDAIWYGVDLLIDLINTVVETTPYVKLEGGEWSQNIDITKNGTDYRYQLVYEAFASGTTNVCLIDQIEYEDSSVYAGLITGIDLDGASYINEKGNKTYPDVYVQMADGSSSDNLPDALVEAGGAWSRIDVATFDGWSDVASIAFDFGNRPFGPEHGKDDSKVTIELLMNSSYGGKNKNGSSDGLELDSEGYYLLHNTCKVYQKIGESTNFLEVSSESKTTVRIKYPPVALPSTGGPGTVPIHVAGMMMLALGASMIIYKRKEEGEA